MRANDILIVGGTSIDHVEGRRRLGGPACYITLSLLHIDVGSILIMNSSILKIVSNNDALILHPRKGSDIIHEITVLENNRSLTLIKTSKISLFKLLRGFNSLIFKGIKGTVISPILGELNLDEIKTGDIFSGILLYSLIRGETLLEVLGSKVLQSVGIGG